jgi:hypothetical protein
LAYNPSIKRNDFKNIIRAAKRIESLVKIASNNWNIVDAFSDLDVGFFRSTSISVYNYKCWLNLVEMGNVLSEQDGKSRYLLKKQQESQSRKDELAKIYSTANINSSDLLSNVNWGDDE